MDVFTFARYTKEDFDSDGWEKKRTVIKALGADLKLAGRTIQFTPVKYLIPIEKSTSGSPQQSQPGRTDSQQRKNGLNEARITEWYTVVKEVATMIKDDFTSAEQGMPTFFFSNRAHSC